jgi:hypothetical protein
MWGRQMKNVTLKFLQAESDDMRREADLLRNRMRLVYERSASSRKDLTSQSLESLQARIARFDELIAALQARLL